MSEETQNVFLVRKRVHDVRTNNSEYRILPMTIRAGSLDEAHKKLKSHLESSPHHKIIETEFRSGHKCLEVISLPRASGIKPQEYVYYTVINTSEITQIN